MVLRVCAQGKANRLLGGALRPIRRQGGMPEQTKPGVAIPEVTTKESC